jgi:hypothetical protein
MSWRAELGRALRMALVGLAASLIVLYAGVVELVHGSDGASVSLATALHAGDDAEAWSLANLPGVQQIAGVMLLRSFDPSDAGGCLHLLHANAALEVDTPSSQREQLLGLMWAYMSLGADPNTGCDNLGAPPLWDAVLDLDRTRVRLLLASGADPDRVVVRTSLHPLGLNLHELIALMRIRHTEHAAALATIDEIEQQLWSTRD